MTDKDPQRQLAAALGRIPSGLFILTARRGDAETGMLASWVQQCSFDPPQLTVAVKRERDLAAWLTVGAAFTVNVLGDTQADMNVPFGRGSAAGEPAFTGLEVERPDEGGPVLAEALACLACRVAARHATGDHDLIVGRVVAGRMLGEGQ